MRKPRETRDAYTNSALPDSLLTVGQEGLRRHLEDAHKVYHSDERTNCTSNEPHGLVVQLRDHGGEETDACWREIEERSEYDHDIDEDRTSRATLAFIENIAWTNRHNEVR